MTYPGQQYPPQQPYPQGNYPPPGWAPPPPPKRARKWPWIAGGIVLFLVVVGSCNGANSSSSPASSAGASSVPTVTAVAPSVVVPAPAAEAAPAPAQSGPMTTFGDVETLAVGTDIEPGQYTTDGAPGGLLRSNCYYEIHKSDAGTFEDLVKNGNIGEGGKGRVTLKKGQYFSSMGGCTWTKAG